MENCLFQRFRLASLPILIALFCSILFPPSLSSVLLENADLVELSENPAEEEQTEKSEVDDFLFGVFTAELASQKARMGHMTLFANWNKPTVDIDLPPPKSLSDDLVA